MRAFKCLYVSALAAGLLAGACAQNPVVTDRSQALVPVPSALTLSGNYLAGRFAQRQQDWDSARHYMGAVLTQDQGNDQLLQRTFLLALGAGNFGQARELAKKISTTRSRDDLSQIFMICDAINQDDFAAALALLDKLPTEGFGQYTKPLLAAWALAGQGKKKEALRLLAKSAAEDDPTYHIHAGLMEEMSGDMNAAAGHYKAAMENGLTLHTAIIVSRFYERYGRPEISRKIYQSLNKAYAFNPFMEPIADPGRTVAPNITRAAEGAAVAIFDLAMLLYEKRAYDSAQVYGGIVQMLTPASPFVRLMMGDISALNNQYAKAIAHYGAIDAASPVFWLSRVRIAEVYEMDGQLEQSVRMLTGLTQQPSVRLQAFVSLGDIYRRHDQFENAVKAYDQALTGVSPLTAEYWPIIYARGIAQERLNRWPQAEKDLLQALSFQPDNPMILNFLAYSWADKGINLDRALEYIKHAAALSPDDGYILDSYGWTLFRLARFQESIDWLEQAVARLPDDSTLLDHLGDAYWQVGRQNEARHQWRHANDLSRDPAFKAQLQKKLQQGLGAPAAVDRKQAKL